MYLHYSCLPFKRLFARKYFVDTRDVRVIYQICARKFTSLYSRKKMMCYGPLGSKTTINDHFNQGCGGGGGRAERSFYMRGGLEVNIDCHAVLVGVSEKIKLVQQV